MYYFILFFIIYTLGIVANVYLSFKLTIACLIIFFVIITVIKRKYIVGILIILFFVLSCLTTYYNSKSNLVQYNNQEINTVIKVVDEKSSNTESKYNSYNVNVIEANGKKINEKAILYVDNNLIRANSIIKIRVEVSELLGNKNNILYSYKDSLRKDKIFTSLFAKGKAKILQNDYSKVNRIVNSITGTIEDIFYKLMSKDNANIILSIILGDTSYLEDSYYKNVQRIGLAHIFAVSGLHIAILYTALLKLFTGIGVGRKISWIITWVLLWCYGFFIGFPISVLRSLLMFTFVFGAEVLYRKYSSINSIVISALILLIYNPFYLFDVGFQLSYCAAFCLILYNSIIKKKLNINNEILNSLCLYVFIQIFTLPLLSYYFNYISILGVIYNLLVVPIFSIIIIVAFCIIPIGMVSIYTAVIPLKVLDYIMCFINYLIEYGSSVKLVGVSIGCMSVLFSIYYYCFIALAVYLLANDKCKYKNALVYSYFMLYLVEFIVFPMSYAKRLEINIVDVGQGLFVDVNYKNKNMIFDVGSNSTDIGKYVAVPYLVKHSVKDIDAAFISHLHTDHYNGLEAIVNSFPVKELFTSHIDENQVLGKKATIINNNNIIKIDNDFQISVLWPDENYQSSNENNMSNVFLLEFMGKKILLAGDIEKEVENKIYDRLIDVDILIVPHHGSNTSSTDEFIEKTAAELVIFSYGRNTYGIPSQYVIDRYNSSSATILSTFIDGEINIMLSNDRVYYRTYIGNNSQSINELLYNNFMLNFITALLLVLIILFNKSYIKDLRLNAI